MKMLRLFIIILLFPLLAGCPSGDNFGQREIAFVHRTDTGLCFAVKDAGDFQPWYLTIKPRKAAADAEFDRILPALNVSDGQLCIPDSYYQFPDNGDFYVNHILHSPTRTHQRLILISVFRLVNGQPQMLEPEPGEF